MVGHTGPNKLIEDFCIRLNIHQDKILFFLAIFSHLYSSHVVILFLIVKSSYLVYLLGQIYIGKYSTVDSFDYIVLVVSMVKGVQFHLHFCLPTCYDMIKGIQ